MRVKGADFKRWMREDMPAGYGFENPSGLPAGLDDEIPENAIVDTAKLGRLVWKDDPGHDPTGGRGLALAKRVRGWLAAQQEKTLLVRRGEARPIDATLAELGVDVKRGADWAPKKKPGDGA